MPTAKKYIHLPRLFLEQSNLENIYLNESRNSQSRGHLKEMFRPKLRTCRKRELKLKFSLNIYIYLL